MFAEFALCIGVDLQTAPIWQAGPHLRDEVCKSIKPVLIRAAARR
jgi:hypothetical protein